MQTLDLTTICYAIYLVISLGLTVYVARTLFRHGRVFLLQAFHQRADMADSVNHLLVVGFYLINAGYVTLALRYGTKPENVQEAVEFICTKVGLVLVVLGVMHFFNLFNFDRLRQKAKRPAVEPDPIELPTPTPEPQGRLP